MNLIIIVVLYVLIFIFDYKKFCKRKDKIQNIVYLSLFSISFLLLVISIFDISIIPLSRIIRKIIV